MSLSDEEPLVRQNAFREVITVSSGDSEREFDSSTEVSQTLEEIVEALEKNQPAIPKPVERYPERQQENYSSSFAEWRKRKREAQEEEDRMMGESQTVEWDNEPKERDGKYLTALSKVLDKMKCEGGQNDMAKKIVEMCGLVMKDVPQERLMQLAKEIIA